MKSAMLPCLLLTFVGVELTFAQPPPANPAQVIKELGGSFRIDDNDILEAIEAEFQFDDAVSADTIDVRVDEGVVEVSGDAFTLLSKQRAVRLVGSSKGVRAVVDRIAVTNQLDVRAQGGTPAGSKATLIPKRAT